MRCAAPRRARKRALGGKLLKRIDEQASELPGTRHVCIGDRESDILTLLVMARKMDHAADYLVRCQHNRVLPEGGQAVG